MRQTIPCECGHVLVPGPDVTDVTCPNCEKEWKRFGVATSPAELRKLLATAALSELLGGTPIITGTDEVVT